MNNTLIIFSSTKSLPVATRIQKNLSKVFQATIWNKGFFEGSHLPPVWTFLKNLMCYDFAVIVLGADDVLAETSQSVMKDGSERTVLVPKDNVVFELGAVMARIGPQKTFIFKPTEPLLRIPSYFDTSYQDGFLEGSDIERITTFLDYRHADDPESIDQACMDLLEKVATMQNRKKFHSDLPSQGLAYGYLSNFVLPVYHRLFSQERDNTVHFTTGELFTPQKITFTVLIPDRIMKREDIIPEIERITGLTPCQVSVDGRQGGRPMGLLGLLPDDAPDTIHLLDIPTTLRTSGKVIDHIDEYWLRDNSDSFISLLESREIKNFYHSLHHLCEEENVLSSTLFSIRMLHELPERLTELMQ